MSSMRVLNVQKSHVFGILLDETSSGFDILTHKRGKNFVGDGCVVKGHLEKRSRSRSIVVSHNS